MSSWLYDPQYTFTTTVNGQLMLTMLVEDILSIPDTSLIQTNTDGATFLIDRAKEAVFNEKCKKWEEQTRLTLEYAEYKEMFVWDVS